MTLSCGRPRPFLSDLGVSPNPSTSQLALSFLVRQPVCQLSKVSVSYAGRGADEALEDEASPVQELVMLLDWDVIASPPILGVQMDFIASHYRGRSRGLSVSA